MNKLTQQIATLVPTLHGWASVEKAISMSAYVAAFRPEIIVEIGVWGGRSAIPMMLACSKVNHGKVICIDPWKPEESIKGQENDLDKSWWSKQNHEIVFLHFQHTVERLQLGKYQEVWRSSSNDIDPPSRIDLLHIDGNHGPQAMTDTERFCPSIPVGGMCVLDDLEWTGGFVKRSGQWLLGHGFIMLHTLGTGAVYLRLK